MKKFLFKTLFVGLVTVIPMTAMAGVNVDVHINAPLPPAIMFPAPPSLVVIPETYVYAVPEAKEDIFFFNGWWWRSWQGRWYRSRHYDSGWAHYNATPSFYSKVPPRWRDDYRRHNWNGHEWNHQRVSSQQLERNWKDWENRRHWEHQQTWGVKGLQANRYEKHEKEALKAQHKAEKQEEKQYKKMEKEERKHAKEMQKEERKHYKEMEKEEKKHER